MTREEALQVLKEYNEWRRGSNNDMLPPAVVGEALDMVVKDRESTLSLVTQLIELIMLAISLFRKIKKNVSKDIAMEIDEFEEKAKKFRA